MTGEGFLGNDVVVDESLEGCKGGKVDHTVLVIGRQDQVSRLIRGSERERES